MKARAICLYFAVGLATGLFTGCVCQHTPPRFSLEWKYEIFATSAKEQQSKPKEEPIWLYPPFYLEAAQEFASIGQDQDTVIVYCTDSADYAIYRYCLVRAGEVIKQCQFRLPTRI